MKIRIKETGELLEDVKFIDTTLHKITIQYLDDGVLRECVVKNLSDIEEVKDYEEPKGHWYLNYMGDVLHTEFESINPEKKIGNYFETKEEAEKAVEKLKAWKRLKDKGFRFTGVEDVERTIRFEIPFRVGYDSCEAEADLGLLFSGGGE